MSLTDAQLKAAIEAQEAGKPRPAGVSWSPYRTPQFWSQAEEDESAENGGATPESASSRYLTELKLMKLFDTAGKQLTAEGRKAALAGTTDDVEVTGGAASAAQAEADAVAASKKK